MDAVKYVCVGVFLTFLDFYKYWVLETTLLSLRLILRDSRLSTTFFDIVVKIYTDRHSERSPYILILTG